MQKEYISVLCLPLALSMFANLGQVFTQVTTKTTTTKAFKSSGCPKPVLSRTLDSTSNLMVPTGAANRLTFNSDCTVWLVNDQFETLAHFCLYYGPNGFGRNYFPSVPKCCDQWKTKNCFQLPAGCPSPVPNVTLVPTLWKNMEYWRGCLHYPNIYPDLPTVCADRAEVFSFSIKNCCFHWKTIGCY